MSPATPGFRHTWAGPLFVLALLLAGCQQTSGVRESTDSLNVGDCLLSPTANNDSARVVDCSQPHRGQVVGVYTAEGGPYPGLDQLASEAQEYCAEAFASFVGSDPLTSVLDLFPLIPTQSSWDEGDTSVVCVAATFGEQEVSQTFEESHR